MNVYFETDEGKILIRDYMQAFPIIQVKGVTFIISIVASIFVSIGIVLFFHVL